MKDKAFMEGFLQFLRSKYGSAGQKPSGTMYGNTPRMPLFEEAATQEFPEEMMQPQQPQMGPDQLGMEMNQLFPQVRDPMRMN
jgi:hypothetical protein